MSPQDNALNVWRLVPAGNGATKGQGPRSVTLAVDADLRSFLFEVNKSMLDCIVI
jgi:hypothetical protein